ncbi:MAG: hypothetical protein IPN70_05395 [Candidatus Moraniibacteriota bacterium]|nr:MAG: hypothetical protein IPN70_05395 [Candidatus Moranbacteria bacterium]
MKYPSLFFWILVSFLFLRVECTAKAQGNDDPYLYVYGQNMYERNGIIPIASTDEPVVNVGGENISGEITVDVYRSNIGKVLEFLRYEKEKEQKSFIIDPSQLTKIISLPHSNGRVTLPLEKSGIFLLHIYSEKESLYSFVIRSTFGTIAKEGDNEFIFWTQDFETKRSVAGANIRVYNLREKVSEKELASSGDDGIAITPLSQDYDIAVAEYGGSYAVIPLNLRYLNYGWGDYTIFDKRVPSQKSFLFLDRPMYQPGDKIYFKSILREDDDVRYSIPKGSARVELYSGWGEEREVIFTKTYTISEKGSFDGEFQIPESVKTGGYNLDVYFEGSNEEDYPSSSNYFSIEYYEKPEFGLDAELVTEKEIISGEEITLNVKGSYFSGEPVSGQKVSYKVSQSAYYEYDFFTEEDDSNNFYGYYSEEENLSEEIVLDDNGEGTISFLAKNTQNATEIYGIEMVMESETGQSVIERKNVLVRSADFGIYRDNEWYGSRVGEKQKIDIQLHAFRDTSLDGRDLSVDVSYSWWEKNADKYEFPNGFENKEGILDTWKIKTDKKGKASIEFSPTHEGSYSVLVSGMDDQGNVVGKKFYLWIVDENGYDSSPSGEDSLLNILLEKEKYNPGEKAEIKLVSDISKRDVFVTFEREYVHRYKVLSLSGKDTVWEESIGERDMPNIFLNVSSFNNNSLEDVQKEIKVSTDSELLDISITPDKNHYEPGETVTVSLDVKNKKGIPQEAEVTLWAVDKAIFELSDANTLDISSTFWGLRWNGTEDAHSLEGIGINTAEMGGCFSGDTQILMADGSEKSIKDVQMGEWIQTRKSSTDATLISAQVEKTHHQKVSGYITFNENLRVTTNHILFANGIWKRADEIRKGDVLVDKEGKNVVVETLDWKRDSMDVFNLEIDTYYSYFANGFWVHNGKDGGDARTVFEDVAYWNPSIQTDKNGKATVSFVVPDNLTTWVLSAVSATKDAKVGNATNEIIVSKNVIIRPQLPRILYKGDSLYLTALIQNFSDKERTFRVNLDFSDGGDVEESEKKITLESEKSQRVFWKIQPKKEKEKHEISFSLQDINDESVRDVVTLSLPIIKQGFWDQQAFGGEGEKEYTFSLHNDSYLEKSLFELNISSTLVGSLPSAMKYLVDYPYGCVEQTTSRFVPTVIAKENSDFYKEILEDKNISKMLEEGVKRLLNMQNEDGGWNWWGNYGESDIFVSVYVTEYLLRAQKSGFPVDEVVLDIARRFFQEQSVEMSEDNYDKTVLALYGRSLFEKNTTKEKINFFPSQATPDILSYAVMTNIRNGYTDTSENGIDILQARLQKEGDAFYFPTGNKDHFGSVFASTGMGLRALVMGGGDREMIVGIVRYLTRNRTEQHWHNTFATAQVIQGLTEYARLERQDQKPSSYSVFLADKEVARGYFDAKNQFDTIALPLSESDKNGNIKARITSDQGNIFSTLLIREYRTNMEESQESQGLTITRSYKNTKGEKYSFGVGDSIDIVFEVTGIRPESQYIVLEDQLPSGMVPVNTKMKNEQMSQGNYSGWEDSYWQVQKEYTKNGVIFSDQGVSDSDIRRYSYKARVTHAGTFFAPPATVSLMYEPKVYGRTAVEKLDLAKESEYFIHQEKDKQQKNLSSIFKNIVSMILFLIGAISVGFGIKAIILSLNKGKKEEFENEKENNNITEDNSNTENNVGNEEKMDEKKNNTNE